MNEVMLSILVCTIPDRFKLFSVLMSELYRQQTYCKTVHPTLGEVEIRVNADKKFNDGGLSIGAKRDSLLREAKGKYLLYLDDDESISPDYIETLLRLCNQDKDVCTFRSLSKLSNNWALVDMSLSNPMEQINPFGITRRPPWHVCPVKREYAQLYSFENISYGEDWIWFENVLKHCKTEAHIDKIVHQYNHGSHSEADKIK